MKRLAITAMLTLAFCLALPNAEARKYVELEASYEVRATDIRIPRSGEGVVRVETCDDCTKLRFNITKSTRAFVNEQQITMKQFRNLAMANSAPAYVFYKPGSFDITRIVLDIPSLK